MQHGTLKFGYQLDSYEWDDIKRSWLLIDFDPYKQEV